VLEPQCFRALREEEVLGTCDSDVGWLHVQPLLDLVRHRFQHLPGKRLCERGIGRDPFIEHLTRHSPADGAIDGRATAHHLSLHVRNRRRTEDDRRAHVAIRLSHRLERRERELVWLEPAPRLDDNH
jgi:hypothetical protein